MFFTPVTVDVSDATMGLIRARIAPQQQHTITSAVSSNSIPKEFKVFSLVTTGFSAVKDNILAWAGLTYSEEKPYVTTHYHVRNWYDGNTPDTELDVFEDRLNKTHAKLSPIMYWPYGRTHMDKYGEDKEQFDSSMRAFLQEPQVLVGHKTRFDIDFVSNYLGDSWENIHEGGKANVFDTLSLCKAAFAGFDAPLPTEYEQFASKMAKEQTVQSCGLFPHVDMVYELMQRVTLAGPETAVDKEQVAQKVRAIYALMLTWQKLVGLNPAQ